MDDVIKRLQRLDPVPAPLPPPSMDALLSRLDQHAESTAEPRSRIGRTRTRAVIGQVPVLLAIGISVFVAAVALLVIRHKPAGPTQPSTGPPTSSGPPAFPHLSGRQREQIDYVMKADGKTLRRDSTCAGTLRRLGDPAGRPSLNQGSPSRSMLATIAPLRRAQTPADRLPPRKIWHGRHSTPRTYAYGAYPSVEGIYSRFIRYSRHRDGANYYLVPATNVNWRAPVPMRCYHEQVRALHQELPQIPHGLRAGIFTLQATYLAYERRSTEPYPGLCLSALNDTGNGDGGSCSSLGQIEAGHTLTSGAPGGVPVVYGLAPDGVHSVTFYYHGRYPGKPLTALVINNVFILHDPQGRLPNNGFPDQLVWNGANGHVIKTIPFS